MVSLEPHPGHKYLFSCRFRRGICPLMAKIVTRHMDFLCLTIARATETDWQRCYCRVPAVCALFSLCLLFLVLVLCTRAVSCCVKLCGR